MSKAENQKTFIKSMIDFDKRHAFEKFDYKAQAIWSLTQNYTHRSVWDYELLSNKNII